MRIFKLLLALLVAFLHIALTFVMAVGFLVFLVPSVIVRHSLRF